jgi:hypothetical protein
MSMDKQVSDTRDKVPDVNQQMDSTIGSTLQSSERLAYGGNSPVDLGFSKFSLTDGDKTCAS